MEAYRYPGWLTENGNIRTRSIEEVAAEKDFFDKMLLLSRVVTELHNSNCAEYSKRDQAHKAAIRYLIDAYGNSHELVRKIAKNPPEQPPKILEAWEKFRGKVQDAREETARRDRQNALARWRRNALKSQTAENDYWWYGDKNNYDAESRRF